jgi:hypothetical protein
MQVLVVCSILASALAFASKLASYFYGASMRGRLPLPLSLVAAWLTLLQGVGALVAVLVFLVTLARIEKNLADQPVNFASVVLEDASLGFSSGLCALAGVVGFVLGSAKVRAHQLKWADMRAKQAYNYNHTHAL